MKWHEKREQLQSLRNSTDEDLVRQLNEAYRDLFNLRMRHATRQLEDDNQLRHSRRTIARIRTVQRERSLARAYEAAMAGK